MNKQRSYNIIKGWVACLLLLLLAACNIPQQQTVDDNNDKAYAQHYRNLDSVKIYADTAYRLAKDYEAGKAEALNNLAFIDLAKMRFNDAYNKLDAILKTTDNQVELLVADIQLMRLCQRESLNKEFYDYYEQARKRIHRIEEDEDILSVRQRRRMIYARSEFAIVTSAYYYYVGLEQPSIKALNQIKPDGEIQTDIPQLLAYYYNIGAGGILNNDTQQNIEQKEFEYLIRCYTLARQHKIPYWEANSLQAISKMIQNDKSRETLINNNLPYFQYLNDEHIDKHLLPINFAQRALYIFQHYGDVYQTAGSYRTLASCYWHTKDYSAAIKYLNKALHYSPAIKQAPELIASIRERLSVAYSAINNKQQSDYNRNIYLDLQNETRQDRYLTSRAEQLENTSNQLNIIISAVAVSIFIVLALLILFHYLRRRRDSKASLDELLLPLEQWRQHNEQHMKDLVEQYEEISEQLHINNLHLNDNKRKHLEQRAKISLVYSIIPLIDRMLHEIDMLKKGGETDSVKVERYTYIRELTDKINELNNVLTEWIQLRQGKLSLHVESFPIQQVFDIVKKGRMGFQMKGIDLRVDDSETIVKADRILTLFMVNTLADNARKFTEAGGKVTINSTEKTDCIEISVTDTGCGLTEQELLHIFDHKPIHDHKDSSSHGFGLMNCKGIINKYKKMSNIFSVCEIGVESEKGKGSRFFFRLPKGISRILLLSFLSLTSLLTTQARPERKINKATALAKKDYNALASIYADSAYFSNINGEYTKTLDFADTCRHYLNLHYHQLQPKGKVLMKRIDNLTKVPAEIKWYHDSLPMNYTIILDIRNESAVAALALHEWDLYKYNNSAYTHLFKERYADNSLGNYCRMMAKSETNKNVALALLVLFLLSIFPVYYVMYYRHRLIYHFCLERVKHLNAILLSDISEEDKLNEVEKGGSDRFPERLLAIVNNIKEALTSSVEENQKSQSNIELLEDEVRCVEYEKDRLYISNSIIDNCLSTLKHETMYYPSRIRQLVDEPERQLDAIDELAVYYKELYQILSLQAISQIKSVQLVSRPVDLSSILNPTKLSTSFESPLIKGDPIFLAYLFDILYLVNNNQPLTVTAEENTPDYVTLHILLSSINLPDDVCRNLFQPSADRLMFFICRQIVRDNGEAAAKRGCGITANMTQQGMGIDVVLAKAN